MATFYDPLDLPFFTPRGKRKLAKYAILLNEPNPDSVEDEVKEEPCSLATELLPELFESKDKDDLVATLGEILKDKITSHAEVDAVPIFKPDEILENNPPMLVPVMYRIATENFAQSNKSIFKIIECRNSTKLISDWKPSLPDKLISLGHQVIVVQLESTFVPYTDFAYAVLRQLDCDWKNRLPRSFFFPDDVCKVEATCGRDLCVVSPSMPDGDLEINKKMGLLNYELLMMIKSSCMGAMKNYLMKRDLRVGKFSDTLDGVAALRQLYRQLQDKLRTGESIELGANSMEDLRKLVKQTVGGADVLVAQTWIEYGKRIGLPIPASASSSATSISSARSIIERNSSDDDDDDSSSSSRITTARDAVTSTSPSSGFHRGNDDDGRDCQKDMSSFDIKGGAKEVEQKSWAGYNDDSSSETENDDDDDSHLATFPITSKEQKQHQKTFGKLNSNDEGVDDDDEEFKLETFIDFKETVEKMNKKPKNSKGEDDEGIDNGTNEDEEDDWPEHEFYAESILQLLNLPQNRMTLNP